MTKENRNRISWLIGVLVFVIVFLLLRHDRTPETDSRMNTTFERDHRDTIFVRSDSTTATGEKHMDWLSILTSVIAGGLGGQLVTMLLTERLASRREFRQWLREERFKTFAELIELVSATAPREDYKAWPTNIRNLCQRVHLLFPNGRAPTELSQTMEKLFQLARQKKHGEVTDHDAWTGQMREHTRVLREGLATFLHDPK